MANQKLQTGDRDTANASAVAVDMKLEVVVIPVSDVARAKKFYTTLGWRLDAEVTDDNQSRLIQLTPPGSGCSIQFGTNLFGKNVASASSGSIQGLYLAVFDIEIARHQLIQLGIEASEIFHCAKGFACRFPGKDGRIGGLPPDRGSYGSFVSFNDPDGNGWIVQEITSRLPGRVTGNTSFGSVTELSDALRRAEAAHGKYEIQLGHADPNWADWYADYMMREQAGESA